MSLSVRALTVAMALAPAAACASLIGAHDVPESADGATDATTSADGTLEGAAEAGQDASVDQGAGGEDGAPDDADGGGGVCSPGAVRCVGRQPQVCDAGAWTGRGAACGYSCDAGGCVTYADEVMADHPLAYWRLDDPVDAAIALNETDAGVGLYVGNVTWRQPGAIPSDPSSTSISLSESPQPGHVKVIGPFAAQSEFTGTAPFTLEAWVRPSVIDGMYRAILSNEEGLPDGAKQGYVLYLGGFHDGGGLGYDRYEAPSSTPVHDAGAVLPNAGWFHVVAVYADGSPGQITLYVNGGLAATSTTTLSILPSSGCAFDIGASLCGGQGPFEGNVDEVAVYGTALTQERVQAHYRASGAP